MQQPPPAATRTAASMASTIAAPEENTRTTRNVEKQASFIGHPDSASGGPVALSVNTQLYQRTLENVHTRVHVAHSTKNEARPIVSADSTLAGQPEKDKSWISQYPTLLTPCPGPASARLSPVDSLFRARVLSRSAELAPMHLTQPDTTANDVALLRLFRTFVRMSHRRRHRRGAAVRPRWQ